MFISTEPLPPLLVQARVALRWSQSDLANAFGLSRRTVARYEAGHTSGLVPHQMFILARALYPVDRSLARRAAVAGGETLMGLGLEKPEPPKPPPAPASPPPPRSMLVDSVVYAAAEALDASPRSIRAAVLTAIERALVLGITLEDLTVPPASPRTPPAKPKPAKA
jgi:DNA-binding XRE family transcriptional regulator